jgi:DNA-binding response OmpR family regulator
MAAHLSIVLVEDNDDLRELTAEALRAEGHRVVALSCAEELEDQAGGAMADVFLIDLGLPGEDGYSLARRIRQVQPLVGIIIVSARSDLQDKVDGYDSGADWYLPKPVPMPELLAALKSFARRRQAQQIETDSPAGGLCLCQRELQGPQDKVRLTPSEETLPWTALTPEKAVLKCASPACAKNSRRRAPPTLASNPSEALATAFTRPSSLSADLPL